MIGDNVVKRYLSIFLIYYKMEEKMRIGVDVRVLSEVKMGIGYYFYIFVREIVKEDKKLEFFFFFNKEIFFDYSLLNVNVVVDKKSKFN